MLISVISLATVNKVIIDALFKPIRERWPNVDYWWLFYVALATGTTLGWISQFNIFTELMPDITTGRVLTSILVGGGSSLIHELLGNVNMAVRSISIKNWSAATEAEAVTEKTLAETDVIANTPAVIPAIEQVENLLTPADVANIVRMEAGRMIREAGVSRPVDQKVTQ